MLFVLKDKYLAPNCLYRMLNVVKHHLSSVRAFKVNITFFTHRLVWDVDVVSPASIRRSLLDTASALALNKASQCQPLPAHSVIPHFPHPPTSPSWQGPWSLISPCHWTKSYSLSKFRNDDTFVLRRFSLLLNANWIFPFSENQNLVYTQGSLPSRHPLYAPGDEPEPVGEHSAIRYICWRWARWREDLLIDIFRWYTCFHLLAIADDTTI